MSPPTNPSAIGLLILVRLLIASETGESLSKIQKDLDPLLAHRWSGMPLATALNGSVEALKAAGLVGFLLGKSRKAAPKITLTAEGRRRALEFLGVESLKPRTNWGMLRKTYLPASVLGLPASSDARFKAMASDPIFKAVLIKGQYNLPTAEIPKLDEAIDALAWKLIGFEGETRKFDVKNVKTALLNRELGDGRVTDFKKAASRLVAQKSGARRDDPKELRDAILRDWIDRSAPPILEDSPLPLWGGLPKADVGRRNAESEPDRSSFSLQPSALSLPVDEGGRSGQALAERVKAAARACPTGRYGDNKVFIVHVWRMLQSDPDFAVMGFDPFKEFLAEANNARLLDLSRADLVQAMDPDDVRLSEVHYLSTTFHFIRI